MRAEDCYRRLGHSQERGTDALSICGIFVVLFGGAAQCLGGFAVVAIFDAYDRPGYRRRDIPTQQATGAPCTRRIRIVRAANLLVSLRDLVLFGVTLGHALETWRAGLSFQSPGIQEAAKVVREL